MTERRVTPGEKNFFYTGNYDDPDVFLGIAGSKEAARERWAEVRDDLLREWIADHPGSRPDFWWRGGDAPEHRRRTGGKGEAYPGYDHPLNLRYGIPFRFMRQLDVDIFRSVNPKGGREYEIFDAADAPRFESQASYLRRNGLFLLGEEARLSPEAFADEVIEEVDDDESSDNNKEGL